MSQHLPAGEAAGERILLRGSNPHGKAALLCDLAVRHNLRTLVETGIYQGQGSGGLAFERGLVDRYIAIDTSSENLVAFLRDYPSAEVAKGDSGIEMAGVLVTIDEPALLWLDAHEPDSCPLLAELDAISAWEYAGRSVLAIDDLRMMSEGRPGWPTLTDVWYLLVDRWSWSRQGDILICEPLP